ncbi:DUF1552 domain-containing protein [Anatilimnocola sp. NA78]|uniref:DUF1552 domain-containing protein n=1 Tax=Anatilimnocola sp. NA78 TaxID=3415683 RepID=UPI003CE5C413
MTTTRRQFNQHALLGTGALALLPQAILAAPAAAKPPMRFIFMHRGNGLFPRVLVPPTFSKDLVEKEQQKAAFDVDLDKHELPHWLSPLTAHKEHLTLLQGLSGKMCTTGHHSWCSSLGVFKANERVSSIRWATVDFELAKLFPSPLEHIELACFPLDGGNPRGSLNGIAQGFSARGPQQPNYAFGSPQVALREMFKSVSTNPAEQIKYQLERKVLEFVARNEGDRLPTAVGTEQPKIKNYSDAVTAVQGRMQKVDLMKEVLRQHTPQLAEKYLNDDMTTLDRQAGHTEVLLAALISGLTNVVAFTVDELGHHYTGIPGLETEKVNMHDIGHGKMIGGIAAEEVRARSEQYHMTLVDRIVTRLKSVREGDGTMFDNTMLFYFPDSGETHHSLGLEFPFVVLSGRNSPLNIARRYIRLPNYGQPGHKTLGNWYTTLLNAFGNPIPHYGELDTGIAKFNLDQKGPISQFLA